MPSKDVVGYPPRKTYFRTGLEKAWLASFKALDIGSSNFPTFEDFLINGAADRTYADALAQIEKIALDRTELSIIKESRELEEKGGIEQYKEVAENLRQSGDEYHASAIDALIAELIVAQSKPKRKAPEKRERKAKPLTTFPVAPLPEKTTTDYIAKLCKQSPLNQTEKTKIVNAVEIHDIEAAIKIIKECKTLDEFDKFELEERLRQKAMGITMPAKERVPKAPTKPEPRKRIITAREVTAARKEEERVLPFKAVEYEYHTINLQNAKLFLRDYQQYLPGMLREGLQKWLETHRTAFKFPLTTHNIDSLSAALQYSIIQPEQKSVRNTVAVQFVSKHAPDIIVRGLEKASSNFAWSTVYSYYKDTLKKDMPPIEKFKQDVIGAAKSIQFSFD